MKLKKFIAPILAICLAFGVCAMATACGEKDPPPDEGGNKGEQGEQQGNNPGNNDGDKTDTDEITFTINIATNGANMSGVTALFYNSENSKVVSITDSKATANLPKGEYVVYLTGVLNGFVYDPIRVSEFVTEAQLQINRATPNADGAVPIQVLYLLEPDKILEADPDNSMGQVCNTDGCFTPYFDEFSICRLTNRGDLFYMPKGSNDIHEPTRVEYSKDDYSFDNNKYKAPENGGFISVLFDKL